MLEIRPAQGRDQPRIAAVGLRAWDRGIAPLVPEPVRLAVRGRNPFATFLDRKRGTARVGLLDGLIVGIGAREVTDSDISDLWVDPAFEGRGVGSALLTSLEAEATAAGHEVVTLSVLSDNKHAFAFYRRRNYVVLRRSVEYSPILGIDVPKTLLVKRLTPSPPSSAG